MAGRSRTATASSSSWTTWPAPSTRRSGRCCSWRSRWAPPPPARSPATRRRVSRSRPVAIASSRTGSKRKSTSSATSRSDRPTTPGRGIAPWRPKGSGGAGSCVSLFGGRGGRSGREAVPETDAAIRRALGAVLEHDLASAEAELARAVRRDSDAVDAYLALARIFRQRGEIGRAIHLHQNLLLRRDLDDDARFRALLGLADDFREGGFLRRAIAAYEEVLTRAPRDARALRALVRLLVDAREPARAIPLARRLARLEGDAGAALETSVWVELAETERAEGRTQAARKALRRALKLDPQAVRAWVALGEVEAELGHAGEALAAWRRVPEVDRRAGPVVYPRIAASFAAVGRAREYESWLRELLAADGDDPGARLALARALAARGAAEDALAEVRSVLERDPRHLDAHVALGRILLAEGREAEVAKAHGALVDLLERERVRLPADAGEGLA
ncbi:MAG: hypothetical protein DCC71_09890 [Proteobacteria bacterium]|nr:MAG: hypothetical protein DCC71_09890 [Pseudomonadota bacterium]